MQLGTFHSDRDGVGRSMAVSSVAWLLATNGRRVLIIDWDLRKPTIHKYLGPFLSASSLAECEGVIDFLWEYGRSARHLDQDNRNTLIKQFTKILPCRCDIDADWHITIGGELHFVPAGRPGIRNIRTQYFSWREFVDRLDGHDLLDHYFALLSNDYDYVLVDIPSGPFEDAADSIASRSDFLVSCFTYDPESIDPVAADAKSLNDRIDTRRLRVFPLAMRTDSAEMHLMDEARKYAQNSFSWLEQYLADDPAKAYIDEVPEIPYFKYQRVLPVLAGPGLSDCYQRFVHRVTGDTLIGLPAGSDDRWDDIRKKYESFRREAPSSEAITRSPPKPYQGAESYSFVSYARDDLDRVVDVIRDLATLGYRLWWDEEIVGGMNWSSYLGEKIRASDSVLLFVSRRSMASEYVEQEVLNARAANKALISVRLDWAKLSPAIESFVSQFQMLDRNSERFKEHLGRTMEHFHPTKSAT
jgi:TIR domain